MRLLHNCLLLTILKIGDSLIHGLAALLVPLMLCTERGRNLFLQDEDSFIEQMEDKTLTKLGERAATIRKWWKNEN